MRPIPRLVVALALAVLAVVPTAWAADTSLHLVLTPSQKPTDLLAAGEEFGRALGRLVGASVRVTVASDYAAGARAERGPEALLWRVGLVRRPRRVVARAAERSRGRVRVV